jgi:hypothetical protein
MSDDVVLLPELPCEHSGRHRVVVRVYELELEPVYKGSRWLVLNGDLSELGYKIKPNEFGSESHLTVTSSCCKKAAAATGIKSLEEDV